MFRGEARYDQLPEHLIQAVLATEDRNFFSHYGVDPRGIMRAAWRNYRAGTIRQGASTITQQLVRQHYVSNERTWTRKIREAMLAVWLERAADKKTILTNYLNDIYFGSGAYGITAASEVYFGKQPNELSLEEAALLAGTIKAPSVLNPAVDLDASRARGRQVLRKMVEAGFLSGQQEDQAVTRLAGLTMGNPAPRGNWFGDWAYSEAQELLSGKLHDGQDANVETTLDPELQHLAQSVLANTISEMGNHVNASQAALVALRPDGSVAAMVGGTRYLDSQFNRAHQALRQPGSLFKLFVYYAALRQGISPRDLVNDAPLRIKDWEPQNFDHKFDGNVTLANAFARSRNIPAIRLAMHTGIPQVAQTARTLGLDADLIETPSLALGASEVTLLDITGAFASIRAGKAPVEPWGIKAITMNGVRWNRPSRVGSAQVVPLSHKEEMVALLRKVVTSGTGRRAAIEGKFIAGKTGTSENYRDAWFIGFTDELTVGVWVGNDDNSPMNRVTGGGLPAQIWRDFVSKAIEHLDQTDRFDQLPSSQDPLVMVDDGLDQLGGACNINACQQAYRSFRASDCTYQPYDGPRRLCIRGGGFYGDGLLAAETRNPSIENLGGESSYIMAYGADDQRSARYGTPVVIPYQNRDRFIVRVPATQREWVPPHQQGNSR